MSGFETFVVVDWSAKKGPSPRRPTKDAIWVGVARNGAPNDPEYFRTRKAAEGYLSQLIDAERTADRRMLLAFDFPFGYPRGFARALTGKDDPFAVWDWIADRIDDRQSPDKTNNRFDVAEEMNRGLPGGPGPFWGKSHRDPWPDLPYRKEGIVYDVIPEKRICDEVAGTSSSCFQLFYNPTVGSQVLMGLPMLNRLRRLPGVVVWPFQDHRKASIVLAEIWPGLIEAAIGLGDVGVIRDAEQVTRLAVALSRLDGRELDSMFDGVPEEGRREEAWILGAGERDLLTERAGGDLKVDLPTRASR